MINKQPSFTKNIHISKLYLPSAVMEQSPYTTRAHIHVRKCCHSGAMADGSNDTATEGPVTGANSTAHDPLQLRLTECATALKLLNDDSNLLYQEVKKAPDNPSVQQVVHKIRLILGDMTTLSTKNTDLVGKICSTLNKPTRLMTTEELQKIDRFIAQQHEFCNTSHITLDTLRKAYKQALQAAKAPVVILTLGKGKKDYTGGDPNFLFSV